MTKIKLVTDSTAILSDAEIAEYAITVVPLTIVIDETTYQDGVNLGREEFMDKMAVAKNLPKTSTPSIGTFQETYERLLAEDDDTHIISIHLTPGLSGTYNAAQQAANMFDGDRITVIDSAFIDRSLSFQVLHAGQLINAGASVAEVVAEIAKTEANTELYLTVASLDNLVSGGRLSKTVGLIGGLLNIRIGAHVVNGDIQVENKGRGAKSTKAYLAKVIEKMHAAPNGIEQIGLSHAGIPDTAQAFGEILRTEFPDAQIAINQTSPTISTHTGVGAFGLSYLKK